MALHRKKRFPIFHIQRMKVKRWSTLTGVGSSHSPECSSVSGTALWPQSTAREPTRRWRSLRSRHWFPRGSRAGSLPGQSESEGYRDGEKDRKEKDSLFGTVLMNTMLSQSATLWATVTSRYEDIDVHDRRWYTSDKQAQIDWLTDNHLWGDILF